MSDSTSPRTRRTEALETFPLYKPKQNALSPLSIHLAVSVFKKAVYTLGDRLQVSRSLKAMHSALDLHAKMTTQTERKPFRIIFPHCGRLYQIQFPGAQMSCGMSSGRLFNLPARQFFHAGKQGLCYWPPLESWPSLLSENMFLYTENQLRFGKITLLSVQRVTSERATPKSTGGTLKESLWHPSPQISGLNQSEAGPADAQVIAHQALSTNAHFRPVTLSSMLLLPQGWTSALPSFSPGWLHTHGNPPASAEVQVFNGISCAIKIFIQCVSKSLP